MIRVNFRRNKNKDGGDFLRIQYYGIKGAYLTNAKIRKIFKKEGAITIESESLEFSKHFGPNTRPTTKRLIRRLLGDTKAKVIFKASGRKPDKNQLKGPKL